MDAKDRFSRTTTVVAFAVLALAAASPLLLPRRVTTPSPAQASAAPDVIRLPTVVRDLRRAHPDFDVVPDGGYGHYAGNIGLTLDDSSSPIFVGAAGSTTPGAAARVTSGTYLGNGFDNRVMAGIGFKPDFIVIKGDDPQPAYCRTSTMIGDLAKNLAAATGAAANRIQSVDESGFTLGSDANVNKDNKSFFWTAFKVEDGVMAVSTYVGDGNPGRAIGGAGFRPDVVIVVPEGAWAPYLRTSTMPAGKSTPFDGSGFTNDRITAMTTDGFTVGGASEVNASGKRYHFAAWRATPGSVAVGSYVGSGAGRVIDGIGLDPDYVLVKANTTASGAHRSRALCGDDTLYFKSGPNFENGIEVLMEDGFRLGSATAVNRLNDAYHWAAFAYDDPFEGAVTGFKVLAQWHDEDGNPIAPHMYGVGDGPTVGGVDDFDVDGTVVVPNEDFLLQVKVVGAAIDIGAYDMPITMRMKVGEQLFEPFGPFTQPVQGNLNDDQTVTGWANPGTNPRTTVLPTAFPAGTPINVLGRSWKLVSPQANGHLNSSWTVHAEADSSIGTARLKVLRDGDPIPDIAGYGDQEDVDSYIADYADPCTGLMTMSANQVIYLYELGHAGDDPDADFQDLVVLLTLGNTTGGFGGGPVDSCGDEVDDAPGIVGPPDRGGITSAETFSHWFLDAMGQNLSTIYMLTLTNDGTGVYEYLTDEFHPIDGRLFGNEGDDHNQYLTLAFAADFVYGDCSHLFFEFEGDDDAWAFVNGVKVLDVGGVLPGTKQHISLDRLGLTDGQTCTFSFFFAQRQSEHAVFRMRTNIPFIGRSAPVTGSYD